MNCIIPFTKDIKFNTNISEILSISLEHDYTLNPEEILGNFLITGEYKTHEVSVNKEKFEYSLPFSVSLMSRIKEDTLDFNIEDFTYEVIDNNTLRVNIEYSIKALEEEKKEEVKLTREDTLDIDDLIADNIQSLNLPKEDVIPEVIKEEVPVEEDKKEVIEVEAKEELNKEEQDTILNSINSDDNEFVTYHIHVLKENETIETVCTKYATSTSLIGEYNDLSNLTIGDKIIIPDIDE